MEIIDSAKETGFDQTFATHLDSFSRSSLDEQIVVVVVVIISLHVVRDGLSSLFRPRFRCNGSRFRRSGFRRSDFSFLCGLSDCIWIDLNSRDDFLTGWS